MTTLCNCMICQMQEDADNAGQWKATFEKTVAAYQRNLDQHPTGLLADFYMYDESHKVYNAATGRVHEKETDGSYWFNACRFAHYSMPTRMPHCRSCHRTPTAASATNKLQRTDLPSKSMSVLHSATSSCYAACHVPL